jgi:PAS domain S-box-containing protein
MTGTVVAGKRTMDDLRALIANMETEQRVFDGQRQAAVRRWRATMVLYVGGGFVFFIVFGLALLQRRQAEARREHAEEAARANELFRSLVENLSDMAWTAGPDGRVDFRNRRWVEYTGLSLEEIERSGASLHDPTVFPEMMRGWQSALVAGEPFEMEYPLRGADGAFRWFLMRVRPLRDRSGRIARWFGTNTDVTRLKELADELAGERARLQSLINQMPVAVVLFEGEEPRFELTNPAFERLVRRQAPPPGTPASEIAREIHGQLFLDALADCRRTGEPRSAPEHVATIRGDNGQNEERVFTTSFAALRNQAGRIAGVVSATIDVTDQVRARQSLETSIRFAEEFVGIVSHDLRDPLQAISVAAMRLKRSGRLAMEDIRPVDMILSGAGRMARMVTQLLDLSHTRLKGAIPVDKKVVDISKVLAPIVDELRLVHPDREILWDVDGQGMCLCDGDRMAQVASNLVANALEHGGPAGPIRVALRNADDNIALVVHNGGPPIPADLLPTIFDLGSRGLVRRKGSKGLGLGLFIAHQIVTAHGGRIDVTSSAQDGTAFRVVLPRIGPTPGLQ